jgi:pimeloyl-ACP methyl ester carboxylesterase
MQERVLRMPKINMPTLVVHGDENRMPPYETIARRLPALIQDPPQGRQRRSPVTGRGGHDGFRPRTPDEGTLERRSEG